MKNNPHIVIIGNGIAGVTCARNIRKKSNAPITIVSGESDYFFSRTALMYIYMGHMRFQDTKPYEDKFWKKNKIDLLNRWVQKVDTDNKELIFSNGEKLSYGKLVLAVGSVPNKFGWEGQELEGVQGLYHLQDLELMEKNTQNIQHAVIVGGGLIGVEMAEMLRTRGIKVTFLVRESGFWGSVLPKEESELVSREIANHGVDIQFNTELESIEGENGKVSAIITKSGERMECQFVGLTVGVRPNIEFLKDSGIELGKGILVNEFFETNIPDVFSIGDCAEFRNPREGRKSLEQVWYTGKLHGEHLANNIAGLKSAYNPGHWFNSAKFFTIEYQTYGWVSAIRREDEETLYWEHPDGDKCVRLVWSKNSRKLIGVNTFGIRMKHHVFNNWLNEERTIDYALDHLQEANFDPEFYTKYEEEIRSQFKVESVKL